MESIQTLCACCEIGLGVAMKEVRKGYADGFVSNDEFSTALRSFQDIMSEKPSANKVHVS